METEILPFQKPEHRTMTEGLDAARRLLQTVESRRLIDAVAEALSWHDQTMHGARLDEKITAAMTGDALRRQIRNIAQQEVRAAVAMLIARDDNLAKQFAEAVNKTMDAHEKAHHGNEAADEQ